MAEQASQDGEAVLEAIRKLIPPEAWDKMDYRHLRAIRDAVLGDGETVADLKSAYELAVKESWKWREIAEGKSALSAILPTHTDHPARHYDRTCPACAVSHDAATLEQIKVEFAAGLDGKDYVRLSLGDKFIVREAPRSATVASEYICKCGIRVSPHRCGDSTEF